MRYLKLIMMTLVFLGVGGCTTSSVPSKEYLLFNQQAKPLSEPDSGAVAVRLLPVATAGFLAGSGIVLVDDDGQIHRSQQHIWSESLADQLSRLSLQRLSQRLPQWHWFQRYVPQSASVSTLLIQVDAFNGDLKGNVHLAGRWQWFSATGKLLLEHSFSLLVPQTKAGYPALVQTLSQAWSTRVLDPLAKQLVSASIK